MQDGVSRIRRTAMRSCRSPDPDGSPDRTDQASGRFFATPGRRGKPGGVGPSLRIASSPAGAGSSCRRRAARRPSATRSGSALGRPRARRRRRAGRAAGTTPRPSAACASAFASATPNVSSSCSSARPQTTPSVRQLRAQRSRNVALAPLRLEQRHLALRQRSRERDPGRAAAGADVDDRPLERARRASTARSASSSEHRAAPSLGSRSAVSPGVATTAASQVEHVSDGRDDDEAVRLGALARRLDAGDVLQPQVDDLALDRRHRIELDALAGRRHLLARVRTASDSSVARRRAR